MITTFHFGIKRQHITHFDTTMKKLYRSLIALTLVCTSMTAVAQYTPPDADALENVIVEKYYISDASDACDEDGGSLPEGAVTYRVYLDLKDGYELETIYGNQDFNNPEWFHALKFKTTTSFFNNEDRGEELGTNISTGFLGDNTVALDSWLTIGGATEDHIGVPEWFDNDGSVVGGTNSDGGSCGTAEGLMINDDEEACLLLTDKDGLVAGAVPEITLVGLDLEVFGDENSTDSISTTSGALAVLGGIGGTTADNLILIGQFTTDGVFTFELNLRLAIPESEQCDAPGCHTFIDYYAKMVSFDSVGGVETENRFEIPALIFDSSVDETSCIIIGLEENDRLANLFSVYPNPTNDIVRLTLSEQLDGNVTYEILDLQGRVLEQVFVGDTQSERIELIDFSDFSAGAYLVKVSVDGAFATERVVKY
jgi:hypothetical protein